MFFFGPILVRKVVWISGSVADRLPSLSYVVTVSITRIMPICV